MENSNNDNSQIQDLLNTDIDDILVNAKAAEKTKRKKNHLILIIVIFSLLILIGIGMVNEKRKEDLYSEAQTLLENGDYKKAEEYFTSLGNYQMSDYYAEKAREKIEWLENWSNPSYVRENIASIDSEVLDYYKNHLDLFTKLDTEQISSGFEGWWHITTRSSIEANDENDSPFREVQKFYIDTEDQCAYLYINGKYNTWDKYEIKDNILSIKKTGEYYVYDFGDNVWFCLAIDNTSFSKVMARTS